MKFKGKHDIKVIAFATIIVGTITIIFELDYLITILRLQAIYI